MNLNGNAVIVKKRAMDQDLKSDLTTLRAKTMNALKKREKKLNEKRWLAEEVKKIKDNSLENLDGIVFDTAELLEKRSGNVFIAKKPIDIAEYIRGIIGREKLAIVPSPQVIESEVVQAFFMSNKVDIISARYAGQETGKPSLHPYIPYPETNKKLKKSDAKHAIISAIVATENGNLYLEEEEMEAFKKYDEPFIIVTADRIFSEKDADKVEHLMEISSGYMIKAEKTDFKGRLIILDNGRLALARSEYKDILKCINCYACSLYCPIYLSIGGLFGAPAMSGIGALSVSYQDGIKAGVNRGLYYCTQCRRCEVECPVDVPITELVGMMKKKARISEL